MQADETRPAGIRRWWWLGALVLAGATGLYAGWDWLAATGVATVLIAVGPCLAMCALGLCMRQRKANEPSSMAEIRKTYDADRG